MMESGLFSRRAAIPYTHADEQIRLSAPAAYVPLDKGGKEMNAARKGWVKGLPPYLGLGILDPSSIYETNGTVKAKYKSGTETVYDVSVSAVRSEIVEYFEGKELSRSIGQELSQAFFYHMMGIPMDDHPRLQELFAEIATGRNIYISFCPDRKLVTYPAGYLFGMRLPITIANRATWEAFAGWLEDCGEAAPLKFDTAQDGFVLKLSTDGNVLLDEVTIADCSTLLLNLEAAVDLIMESGIVLSGKEHRLTVAPIQELAPGRLTVHPGDEGRGFLTFSVLPLTRAKLEEHRLEDLFREVSLGLLASSSRGGLMEE